MVRIAPPQQTLWITGLRADQSRENLMTNTKSDFRNWITPKLPWGLVGASVYLSVRGFVEQGYSVERIAFLTFVLFAFAWLLSETLERFLWEIKRNRNKAMGLCAIAAFFAGVEIHLGHFGMGWLFGEGEGWLAGLLLYVASTGFCAITVFAKYLYGSLSPDAAQTAMDGIRTRVAEDYSSGRVIDMMNEASEQLERVAA